MLVALRQRALRAPQWTLAGHVLGQGLMFGVMAIATMVTVILNVISDVGLDQKIIQSRRGDDPSFLDTAWVIQIARAVLLWILALLLSVSLHFANRHSLLPGGTVYASPILPAVIAVSSVSAIILGLRSTRMMVAHRTFQQQRLTFIELTSQVVGLVVMIVLGIVTRSIWALVAGGLVASMTITVLSHMWMTGHFNRFRWETNALRELTSFGKWILASSIAGVLAVNGDRLLLGGLVTLEFFGLYAIAVLIIGTIEGAIGRLHTAVSLPALSEVARNDPSRLGDAYYKLRFPVDLILLFVAGMLFACGRTLVELLYDPRYWLAGNIVEILAVSLVLVRYVVAQHLYLALGMPIYVTVISVVRLVSLYAFVPIFFKIAGVQAAIWAIALHSMATLPFIFSFNARLKINDLGRELRVAVALPVGYVCGYAFRLALPA